MSLSKKWYIIINPNAGNGGLESKISDLFSLLDSNFIRYEYCFTEYKKHAVLLCKNAIELGYRKIMSVGGDGTNHEVVNGIMIQDEVISSDILFHCIPAGTGNDWIKHHQLPLLWKESVNRIKRSKTMLQDIGVASFSSNNTQKQRYFYNVAGMAYDAFLVNELERKGTKSNKIVYLISVFYYLLKYKLNHVRICFCGKVIIGEVYTVNVGICKYSGGGMSLVPHAVHNDGLLALTVARKLSKLSVLMNTYRFYNLSLLDHTKINGYKTDQINIRSMNDQDLLLELDGELVGKGPIKFTILHNALKFIV